MNKAKIIAVLTIVLSYGAAGAAFAKPHANAGNHLGSFKKEVSTSPGSFDRTTTWTNKKGTVTKETERTWNKDTGTGTYSTKLTTPSGKTITREGTITKNPDGSFTQKGTTVGLNGKETEVTRTYTKNADGSFTVHSFYTGPDGKTLTVDKNISKEDGQKIVEGSYSTSTGKSGTFNVTSNK